MTLNSAIYMELTQRGQNISFGMSLTVSPIFLKTMLSTRFMSWGGTFGTFGFPDLFVNQHGVSTLTTSILHTIIPKPFVVTSQRVCHTANSGLERAAYCKATSDSESIVPSALFNTTAGEFHYSERFQWFTDVNISLIWITLIK